jgi:hypothetical protein
MKKLLFVLLLLTLPACSLFSKLTGEPVGTVQVDLSNAALTAACESKTDTPLQVWNSCTLLSQVTALCADVNSPQPADELLCTILSGVNPAIAAACPVVAGVANAALKQECGTLGYATAPKVASFPSYELYVADGNWSQRIYLQ